MLYPVGKAKILKEMLAIIASQVPAGTRPCFYLKMNHLLLQASPRMVKRSRVGTAVLDTFSACARIFLCVCVCSSYFPFTSQLDNMTFGFMCHSRAVLLALADNSSQAILAQELIVLLSHPSSAHLLRSAFPQPHQPMGYKRQQVFQAAPSFVLPLSFSINF